VRLPAWIAVVSLVILALARSAIATRGDGFTIDEPYHLTAAVSYARDGDFRLNPEHPPLVKLAAGAALAGSFALPPLPPMTDKIAERRFAETTTFVTNDPDRVQAHARMAMLASNGLLLVFFLAAVLCALGPAVAIGTAVFLAVDPTIAAHLPLVMTDLPVALLAGAAVLWLAVALRTGGIGATACAAVALGLTLGAKHSGLVAGAACAAFAVAAVVLASPRLRGIPRARASALVAAVFSGALVLLWAQYGFRFTETAAGVDAFNRPLTAKIDDVRTPALRATLQAMTQARVVPRAYIWGLADTVRAGLEGRRIPVNLFGRTYRDRAPFYFFPVVVAAKLPVGLLVLALAGIAVLAIGKAAPYGRAPAVALALLAAFFLVALARGASYAGVRHALPILVAVSVAGGAALAAGFASRRWRTGAALAVALAAASALPRARPWEYYNELFGGPGGAYLQFADEGIDIGQRTRDIAHYYHSRLAPAGIVPYLFYPYPAAEQKRRGVRGRSFRGEEADQGDDAPTVSGVFIVKSVQVMRNPQMAVFRAATPSERIGNVFVYRGQFHLPWLRERNAFRRAQQALAETPPDLAAAESYLGRVVAWNPRHVDALVELGNLMVVRRDRAAAAAAYARARAELSAESVLGAALDEQARRLASDPIDQIRRVRGVGEE
jgi:hypothetical protein